MLQECTGADTFVFASGHGQNRIQEFDRDRDVIDLSAFDPRNPHITKHHDPLLGGYVAVDLTREAASRDPVTSTHGRTVRQSV